MTDEELSDAIDALYAYDSGCTDSGTHDPRLKAKVREALTAPGGMRRAWCVLVRLNLCEDSRSSGYGWEDLAEEARWCEELADQRFTPEDVLGS